MSRDPEQPASREKKPKVRWAKENDLAEVTPLKYKEEQLRYAERDPASGVPINLGLLEPDQEEQERDRANIRSPEKVPMKGWELSDGLEDIREEIADLKGMREVFYSRYPSPEERTVKQWNQLASEVVIPLLKVSLQYASDLNDAGQNEEAERLLEEGLQYIEEDFSPENRKLYRQKEAAAGVPKEKSLSDLNIRSISALNELFTIALNDVRDIEEDQEIEEPATELEMLEQRFEDLTEARHAITKNKAGRDKEPGRIKYVEWKSLAEIDTELAENAMKRAVILDGNGKSEDATDLLQMMQRVLEKDFSADNVGHYNRRNKLANGGKPQKITAGKDTLKALQEKAIELNSAIGKRLDIDHFAKLEEEYEEVAEQYSKATLHKPVNAGKTQMPVAKGTSDKTKDMMRDLVAKGRRNVRENPELLGGRNVKAESEEIVVKALAYSLELIEKFQADEIDKETVLQELRKSTDIVFNYVPSNSKTPKAVECAAPVNRFLMAASIAIQKGEDITSPEDFYYHSSKYVYENGTPEIIGEEEFVRRIDPELLAEARKRSGTQAVVIVESTESPESASPLPDKCVRVGFDPLSEEAGEEKNELHGLRADGHTLDHWSSDEEDRFRPHSPKRMVPQPPVWNEKEIVSSDEEDREMDTSDEEDFLRKHPLYDFRPSGERTPKSKASQLYEEESPVIAENSPESEEAIVDALAMCVYGIKHGKNRGDISEFLGRNLLEVQQRMPEAGYTKSGSSDYAGPVYDYIADTIRQVRENPEDRSMPEMRNRGMDIRLRNKALAKVVKMERDGLVYEEEVIRREEEQAKRIEEEVPFELDRQKTRYINMQAENSPESTEAMTQALATCIYAIKYKKDSGTVLRILEEQRSIAEERLPNILLPNKAGSSDHAVSVCSYITDAIDQLGHDPSRKSRKALLRSLEESEIDQSVVDAALAKAEVIKTTRDEQRAKEKVERLETMKPLFNAKLLGQNRGKIAELVAANLIGHFAGTGTDYSDKSHSKELGTLSMSTISRLKADVMSGLRAEANDALRGKEVDPMPRKFESADFKESFATKVADNIARAIIRKHEESGGNIFETKSAGSWFSLSSSEYGWGENGARSKVSLKKTGGCLGFFQNTDFAEELLEQAIGDATGKLIANKELATGIVVPVYEDDRGWQDFEAYRAQHHKPPPLNDTKRNRRLYPEVFEKRPRTCLDGAKSRPYRDMVSILTGVTV